MRSRVLDTYGVPMANDRTDPAGTPALDLVGVETAATRFLVAAVRDVREQHPDEHVYGAVFHGFYGDGSMVAWPCVSVGTDESLAAVVQHYATDLGLSDQSDDLRWSGADLPYLVEPGPVEEGWAARAQAAAAAAGWADGWHRVYDEFLRAFPRAAVAAREELVGDQTVDENFIAIAFDEVGALVPLSVTEAEPPPTLPGLGRRRPRARHPRCPAAPRGLSTGRGRGGAQHPDTDLARICAGGNSAESSASRGRDLGADKDETSGVRLRVLILKGSRS